MLIVEPFKVNTTPHCRKKPPPLPVLILPLTVELLSVGTLPQVAMMPAPSPALLPVTVVLFRVSVPEAWNIAPPPEALLSVIIESFNLYFPVSEG